MLKKKSVNNQQIYWKDNSQTPQDYQNSTQDTQNVTEHQTALSP